MRHYIKEKDIKTKYKIDLNYRIGINKGHKDSNCVVVYTF